MATTTGRLPDTESTGSPLVRLMRNPNYVALWLSNALNFGGEQLRLAAQAWWILEVSGSKFWMGGAAGLRVVPFIIVALFAGVLVDRFGGKIVLIWDRAVLAVFALATAFLLISGEAELWHIVSLSILTGTTLALGSPAVQTMVPEVVDKDDLQSANSLNQLGFSLGRTLGPLLATYMIAVKGVDAAFLALTAVYLVSMVITSRINVSRPARSNNAESYTQQISAGLSYVRGNPIVAWMLILSMSLTFWMFMFPAIPVYAREVLNVGAVKFGWMYGALALGQGMMAFAIAAKGGFKRKGIAMPVAGAVFSAGLIAFGFSNSYVLSMVILALMGFAIPVWVSSLITLLQKHTILEFRGRVMSLYGITLQSVSLGWFLGGASLEVFGNEATMIIGAAVPWVIIAAAYITTPQLWRAE